jgi:hypothetical protein
MAWLDRKRDVLKEIKIARQQLRNMEKRPSRVRRLTMLAHTAAALSRALELVSYLRKPIEESNRKGNSDGNVD